LFKNEFKTRQKTIESMRFEFIKANGNDGPTKYLDDARDIGFYKLQRTHWWTSISSNLIHQICENAKKENVSPNARLE